MLAPDEVQAALVTAMWINAGIIVAAFAGIFYYDWRKRHRGGRKW